MTTTESDRAKSAVRYLVRQIDYHAVRRSTQNARRTEALLAEARDSWNEELVVVLDVEGAVVRVLRPGDGTVASRALDPRAGTAPYAISLAAAELLEIVKDAPPAKAARLPSAAREEERPPASVVHPAVWAGALLSMSDNADIRLVQPILGVDARFGRYSESLWYAIGVNASGLLGMTRSQYLALPDGPEDDASVRYDRTQIAARVSLGHRQRDSRAAAYLDLGTARIDVRARDADGDTIRSSGRFTPFAALGGELEYALGRGFFIGFGGGVAFFPAPRRFLATPRDADAPIVAFEEGRLEFRAHPAVLVWEGGP